MAIDSYLFFGLFTYSVLYCLLRWALFPWLVRHYPSLCYGSHRIKREKEDDIPQDWQLKRVVSHASAVLSDRVMAIVLSTTVSILGFYVVWETGDDVIWNRSSVLLPVARFQTGYFIVDLYTMYQETKWIYGTPNTSVSSLIKRLLEKKFLFIIHHLVVVYLGLVVLDYEFRRGRGDFVVGVLCVNDLSTPFQSTYFIHRQMGSHEKNTCCYQFNGAMFVMVYFFCRVLSLPSIYVLYAHQYFGGSLWGVVTSMRWFCHVSCCLGFAFNFYFFMIVLKRAVAKIFTGSEIKAD